MELGDNTINLVGGAGGSSLCKVGWIISFVLRSVRVPAATMLPSIGQSLSLSVVSSKSYDFSRKHTCVRCSGI